MSAPSPPGASPVSPAGAPARRAGAEPAVPTAEAAGMVGCRSCLLAWPADQARCPRCGARLTRPDPASLQRVWAWLIAGMVFYIPANLYPMLRTEVFLTASQQTTILGGVISFLQYGDFFVATVIFVASIVVPVGKFLAIGYLAIAVRRGRAGGSQHQLLFEVVDFIGRWSMIDVFVVAVMSALVQLGFIASIHPGPAAAAFALSVALTMLAAQSFDPRLVWNAGNPPAAPPPPDPPTRDPT